MIDKVKIGICSKLIGSSGKGWLSWWCIKKKLIISSVIILVVISVGFCFWVKLLMVVISKLNVSVFIMLLVILKWLLLFFILLVGKNFIFSFQVIRFIGMLMVNSYCQDVIDNIVVVMVGLVVVEMVIINVLILILWFNCVLG